MLCPNDQTELVISDRQGVEIDYCPKCRGVWLDRGELDKIIDRTMPSAPAPVAESERRVQTDSRNARPYRDDDDDWDDDDRRYGRKKKKRESFLSDLFDF